VLDRGEFLERRCANALGRRVRGYKFGMPEFELLKLFYKTVIFSIRDLGVIKDVIAVIVIINVISERFNPVCGWHRIVRMVNKEI